MAKEKPEYRFKAKDTGCYISGAYYTIEQMTQRMLDLLGETADAETRLAIEEDDPEGILLDVQEELRAKLDDVSEGGLSWEWHEGDLFLVARDDCFLCAESLVTDPFEGEAIRCKDYDGEDAFVCPRCLEKAKAGPERLRPTFDPDDATETPIFTGKEPKTQAVAVALEAISSCFHAGRLVEAGISRIGSLTLARRIVEATAVALSALEARAPEEIAEALARWEAVEAARKAEAEGGAL